jgi:hypothetical protein
MTVVCRLMALGDGFFGAGAARSKTDTVSADLTSSCADLATRHMSCIEAMHGAAVDPCHPPHGTVKFLEQPELFKHARTLHALETGEWQSAPTAGACGISKYGVSVPCNGSFESLICPSEHHIHGQE